ncbi:restriction endonuclease subunit S [Corallococcus caeni]|uniref:Restriction endonuclease subunit S n=1 Tax=Corallococcus caeni TaxID=3082388 RepID=A0ABQ6QLC7_9BACT|nr:restriction endonuclease subunit S [Corallococcus sp. NO1]
MSFPRYPEYKDSGVEWLGEVPAHWIITKLNRIVQTDRPITYGIVQAGPHVPDGIPYVRPADMSEEDGVRSQDDVLRTSAEVASAYIRSTIKTDDLVCSIGPSFGKVMVTPAWLDGANLTQGTARIAVAAPNSLRYVFWVLRSGFATAQWESSIGGATFRALNLGPLAATVLVLPPPNEQATIAAFLDRETAKIDELVGEQQRLIELLKEKRETVISHAVTKGLNPDAPMKPSGFEWLGEVPAHWAVLPLKRLIADDTSISYGIVQPGESLDAGVPFIQTTNMSSGKFDVDSLQKTSAEIAGAYPRSALSGGEVILGIRASIGAAHVVPMTLAGANLSRGVARIVPGPSLMNRYLVAYFGTAAVMWYWELSKQGSTFNEVSIATVRDLAVCVPPVDEQAVIVKHLDVELNRFDALIIEAQRAIELLQERRTALISAAVTGQIDVRAIAGKAAA